MKLTSINIKNYRSIKNTKFDLDYSLKEQAYCFIGINEAGKSSFLEAINLFDQKGIIEKKFIHKGNNKDGSIEILLSYEECDVINDDIKNLLEEYADEEILNRIKIKSLTIKRVFNHGVEGVLEIESVEFNDKLTDCVYTSNKNIVLEKSDIELSEITTTKLDLFQLLSEDFDLKNTIYKNTHKMLFWKSESKFLIDKEINLTSFGEDPRGLSVPLANCFNIIGTEDDDISLKVKEIISDTTERENFVSRIGEEVTKHIDNIWEDNKICIKFNVDSGHITFLIEDKGVKHDSKTTDQRSDGFRQFISFLLSISAEKKTGQLNNSILLIDEPERHLHPKATESFKKNLIEISSNPKDNNIVFFATHSLFMIDQAVLSRNYKVAKKVDKEGTQIEKIDTNMNTYSSIIFEVFNVYTNDYHNELIGWIQIEKELSSTEKLDEYLCKNIGKLQNEKRDYVRVQRGKALPSKQISLPLYIRNQIHHPENDKNKHYTNEELRKSIDMLHELKNKIIKGEDEEIEKTNSNNIEEKEVDSGSMPIEDFAEFNDRVFIKEGEPIEIIKDKIVYQAIDEKSLIKVNFNGLDETGYHNTKMLSKNGTITLSRDFDSFNGLDSNIRVFYHKKIKK